MFTLTVTRSWECPYGLFSRWNLDTLQWWGVERRRDDPLHPAIPAGEYDLIWGMHHPGKPDAYGCYHVVSDVVPDSREIELHVADWYDQLLGCLAPGLRVDYYGSDTHAPMLGLRSSLVALQQFHLATKQEPGRLILLEDL